ncbi:MAG: hypothetical protein V1793_18680 [Pseudomonadota bacterium]
MIRLFSLEFWIAVQFLINLVFVGLLLGLVKRMNRERTQDPGKVPVPLPYPDGRVDAAAADIVGMLESLVREAQTVSIRFEEQIREKKRLVKEVNQSLDSRIISLNLLLARADSVLAGIRDAGAGQAASGALRESIGHHADSFDQQQSILDLFDKGVGDSEIASRLSLPRGEVQLVIGLKKKMMELENQR